MGTAIMVFGIAALILGVMLFSRNSIKKALRQKKTHAVISMVRQVSDK